MKTLKRGLFVVVAISSLGLSAARADQPHMKRALEHLRAARAEREHAEHNKAGWRQRAVNHVNQAIEATENGIRAGR